MRKTRLTAAVAAFLAVVGIIDASDTLGPKWWLLDVHAHSSTAPQSGRTLVPNSSAGAKGQLLAMFVPGSTGGGEGATTTTGTMH